MNITAPSIAAKRSFSKELSHLKTNQQLLTILILLFICMVFWIIISLFSSQTSTKITPEITEMAKPFNPTLSVEVLDTLENKKNFSDQELSNFPIYIIQKDVVTQTESIVELGSGQTVNSPQATVQPTASPTPSATPIVQTGNTVDTL